MHNGLNLLGSKLGWILTGRFSERDTNTNDTTILILTYGDTGSKTHVFSLIDSCLQTKPNIEDFWNVESIGVTDKDEDTDDQVAMKKNPRNPNI